MTTTARGRLGEVSREGDAVVLRYERELAHPPEKVWPVLTESEHLRHWFPADIIGERKAGAPLRITFWPETIDQARDEVEAAGVDPDDPTLPGELLVWDPPRVLELTWDTELLRCELEPVHDAGSDSSGGSPAGTRLLVTVRAVDAPPGGFADTATGYHLCLDALVAAADGAPSDIFDGELTRTLKEQYAALL